MLQIPLYCTGCSACVSVCPEKCILMKDTGDGFLVPIIESKKCIQCNQCRKVCPVLSELSKSKYTYAFAAKNKNDIERKRSTSGGIFSLLAGYVLNMNGVVFGAAYDNNFSVNHISIITGSSLPALQGAKYTQSTIGSVYVEIEKSLKSGKYVLFSGTPCQCEGLKSFLGKEYDNLIRADAICYGVLSLKV